MWHTPVDGGRAATPAEWSLFRLGLIWAFDRVDGTFGGRPQPAGVDVFDALQHGQKLYLLTVVARALVDPNAESPDLTAATEGTLAVLLNGIRDLVQEEAARPSGDTTVRRLVLAAVRESAEPRPYPLPRPASTDHQRWGDLIDELEVRYFWDMDYDTAGRFLDMPPREAAVSRTLLGIDADYDLVPPPDPRDEELPAIRAELATLIRTLTPRAGAAHSGV
jgi:hypothetical protein